MRILFCLMLSLFLSACAPINTQFSCNETAGDKCLSIEEVNAMTEPQEEISSREKKQGRTIWIAPWVDKKGHLHENDTLFVIPKKTL